MSFEQWNTYEENANQPEAKREKGFSFSYVSEASESHPEGNQDALLKISEKKLFGVLDGVGGNKGGNIASNLAVLAIEKYFAGKEEGSLEETKKQIKEALTEANSAVLKGSRENTEFRGMGTTASIVKIWEQGGARKAVIGQIGDSRVYLLYPDGRLEQVTLDDGEIKEVYKYDEKKARALQERLNNVSDPGQLNPEERLFYDRRNVISTMLGREKINPAIHTVDIPEGAQLLITSDGIHDSKTDNEIARILKGAKGDPKAAEMLCREAIRAGKDPNNKRAKIYDDGSVDDASAIVLDFGEAPAEVQPKEAAAEMKEDGKKVEEKIKPSREKTRFSGVKSWDELLEAVGDDKELKKIVKRAEKGKYESLDEFRADGDFKEAVLRLTKKDIGWRDDEPKAPPKERVKKEKKTPFRPTKISR